MNHAEKASQTGAAFVNAVLQAFSFLQVGCSFHEPQIEKNHDDMSSDFTRVRYESTNAFIEVFYAHMEAEISVNMGRLLAKHDYEEYKAGFTLSEALDLTQQKVELPPHLAHPRSEDLITSAVEMLAGIIRNNLIFALCNANAVFRRWETERNRKLETH